MISFSSASFLLPLIFPFSRIFILFGFIAFTFIQYFFIEIAPLHISLLSTCIFPFRLFLLQTYFKFVFTKKILFVIFLHLRLPVLISSNSVQFILSIILLFPRILFFFGFFYLIFFLQQPLPLSASFSPF